MIVTEPQLVTLVCKWCQWSGPLDLADAHWDVCESDEYINFRHILAGIGHENAETDHALRRPTLPADARKGPRGITGALFARRRFRRSEGVFGE